MQQRSERNNAFFFWALFSFCLIGQAFAAETQASPADPSAASLDFANGLYARKMYGPAISEYEKFIQTNPGSPELASARFRHADSLYFTKDYAAAIANFELFIKQFPGDKRVPMAEFRLGTARHHGGSSPRAIRIFRKLSRSAEDPVVQSGSLFYLAKSLEQKGQSARAMNIFRALTVSAKDNEYASYAGAALGDAYLKKADYAEAVNGYKIAAERNDPPELAEEARFKVAEIYFAQKIYDEAATHYERVLQGKYETLRAKALLGLFYTDLYRQDLEGMQKRYEASKATPEFAQRRPEITFLMASLLDEKGSQGEALKYLEEVLADTAASSELKEKAQFKKISVLSEQGRQPDALKELDAYFSAGPANEQALFQKADLLSEIGRYDDALVAYQKVSTDFPGTASSRFAQFQSAATYLKMGKAPQAREAFKSFVNKYASDPSAEMAELQIIQIDLDAQNFAAAAESADKFVKAHPASPMLDIAYYKLGVAATGRKHFGHAAFAFRKVADNFPTSKLYVESLYGAAVSLENDKKIMDALPLYEKLISNHSSHALAMEAWPRLGYLYIQASDIDKLREFYKDLLLRHTEVPLDTDGVFWLLHALLDRQEYEELDRILEALPGRFPEKDLKHETAFFRGESALGKKDLPKAIESYTQALTDADGAYAPQAALGLGVAYAATGDLANADKYFNEALKYDQDVNVTMRARFEMANLRLKAGDLENAATGFMRVAILYDDAKYSPPALYKAGECFASLKKTQDAQNAFSELKTRYPDSEWAKKAPGAAHAG